MENLTKQLMFSMFYDPEKGIKNITPKKAKDFKGIQEIYKSSLLKEITAELLQAKGEERQRIKLQLPFFTPYGTFYPRNNASIQHYNSNLIALDFDALASTGKAFEIKHRLSLNNAILLACISPRRYGVKALLFVDGHMTPETHFNTLKHNKEALCRHLGLSAYIDNLDNSQFKLCQPMFFSADSNIYINENAEPNFKLYEYKAPEIERLEWSTVDPSLKSTRIEKYLINATNYLCDELSKTPEGSRHHSIIKVQKIASWIHYAPSIEQELKNSLENAVSSMYGSHKNAKLNNAISSFNTAWNGATQTANATIESIIEELNTVAQ